MGRPRSQRSRGRSPRPTRSLLHLPDHLANRGGHQVGFVHELSWEDIKTLLAAHEVFDGLLDSWKVGQIDVEKLEFAIRAGIGLFDLLDGGVGLALRATGYVDGAVVLVEDFAQFLADAWMLSVCRVN